MERGEWLMDFQWRYESSKIGIGLCSCRDEVMRK